MGRLRLAIVLAAVLTASACSTGHSGATPGPASRSPFDLPTEDGQVGVYLRGCLSPDTGLAQGSTTPTAVDPTRVTAVIRCEPVVAQRAVAVSRAQGDWRPLVASFAAGPVTRATGKVTTYLVYLDDDTVEALTWGEAPTAAITQARFVALGTTPPGSL